MVRTKGTVPITPSVVYGQIEYPVTMLWLKGCRQRKEKVAKEKESGSFDRWMIMQRYSNEAAAFAKIVLHRASRQRYSRSPNPNHDQSWWLIKIFMLMSWSWNTKLAHHLPSSNLTNNYSNLIFFVLSIVLWARKNRSIFQYSDFISAWFRYDRIILLSHYSRSSPILSSCKPFMATRSTSVSRYLQVHIMYTWDFHTWPDCITTISNEH